MNNPDTLKIYENMGASLAHRVSRQPYAARPFLLSTTAPSTKVRRLQKIIKVQHVWLASFSPRDLFERYLLEITHKIALGSYG